MALQQRVNELTEKFETVEQATKRLQLEKEEYLKEIERLKISNVELAEKVNFLQKTTTDSKQQAKLLSRQLSTHTFELDAESIENKELKNKLKENIIIITNIRKENKLFKETNQRLQIELENMNMQYVKMENELTDSNHEIEAYKTKIMQLENVAELLQERLDDNTLNGQIEYSATFSDLVDDDEEKSLEHSNGNPLQREKTIDRRLTSLYFAAIAPSSTRSQRSGSISRSVDAHSHMLLRQNSALRLQQHFGPMLAIQQSEEFEINNDNITVYNDDDPELDIEESLVSNSVSNNTYGYGQFMFNSASPNSHSDCSDENEFEKLKNIIVEQQNKMIEFEEIMHREKIGFEIKLKVLNDKNENLKQQLTEKDKIIKKCTRQNYELNEQFKIQKQKINDEWLHEKEKIIGLYQEKNEEIIKTNKIEMDKYYNQYKEIENKLNQKIKKIKILQRKNNELQMMVTAPSASSSCYSVANWFKCS